MHPMLNIAIRAARRASQIINRASLDIGGIEIHAKQRRDFVTDIDKASEAAIIETLLQAYPDHTILAEESGQSGGQSEYQWIIDPLDGTHNFIHGFPYYCISIALLHKGVVTQAVIHDPNRDDIFTASKGAGAFLNNRRIRVSARANISDALLGTGFPFRKEEDLEPYLRLFGQMTRACTALRRPGSAALNLANVAAGRLDGYFEQGLYSWDLAAGSLLVAEAGGLVADYTGETNFLKQGEIVAGNVKLAAQMIPLLKPFSSIRTASSPKERTGSAL